MTDHEVEYQAVRWIQQHTQQIINDISGIKSTILKAVASANFDGDTDKIKVLDTVCEHLRLN